ncbi:MAG TPA: phosphoglucosamine mutase [Pyrinomonadaceae bacterium]|nr:phosphoglucosamine mutase [Pyrinomonadaceae bacterium]
MEKLFGTDGIRGEAGAFPLDEKTIERIGRSLARQFSEKLGRQPRFVTGRDTRESGEWIEKAFHAGAIDEGAHCESAEIITTPGVAFVAKAFDFDAGIVVSASHNPFHDNGIKIFSPNGKKIDGATEQKIERDIFENAECGMRRAEFEKIHSADAERYQNAYLDYLAGEFENLRLENFKIVIDCANGAASKLAPRLLEKFGARVASINCQPDGRNINAGCGSLHIEGLQAKVSAEKAAFGAAFDGDADRSLFVDEKGNPVDGDAVLWAMAGHLRARGRLNQDTVVATVMSNLGLEVALRSSGIKLVRTAVGDKYVLEELLKTNASIGGEQSGHIIFPFRSLVGDGMLTMLFLLEAMQESGKTLSELTAGFVRFPQILVNVKVKEKRPFDDVGEISTASKQVEAELGQKGRLLLRYSGTENLARVMIEGENQNQIESQAHRLAEVIKASLG